MDGQHEQKNANAYSSVSPPTYEAPRSEQPQPGYFPQQGTPQQQYPPQQQYGSPGVPQYPAPGHQPYQQQPAYGQPVIMGTMGGRVQNLSQFPAPCLCPNCGQTQITRVSYEAGTYTHIWALVLGLVACCCCIPYMVDGLKDVHHFCANCNIPLAIYHRSGGIEVLAHQQMPLQPQATGIHPQATGVPPQAMSPPVQGYTPGAPAQAPQGYAVPQQDYNRVVQNSV
ncbi:hypothetical protein EXIGLDRAFT_729132 [Exidia glandulosa HHB12029]|uniref:LITAF domain-containing protein n=1 Tax=Exidia glandulosa HHB12029 TaxID=1314781 RepID=A0A165ZHZ4_EXIGL|nr:hypothetical protein EXIGLDRAFT_729132 [Exidia glandulosa HHB12029]